MGQRTPPAVDGVLHKRCGRCKEAKPQSGFNRNRSRSDGVEAICRACHNAHLRTQRRERGGRERDQRYEKTYRPRRNQLAREHYSLDPGRFIRKSCARHKRRKVLDPMYRSRCYIGNRLRRVLKAGNAGKRCDTVRYVGCSFAQLQCHLEKQFDEFMSWSNMGKWHIDHRLPIKAFDPSNPAEAAAMFHYTNLQPMWAKENIRKSDTYDPVAKVAFMRAWRELIA